MLYRLIYYFMDDSTKQTSFSFKAVNFYFTCYNIIGLGLVVCNLREFIAFK
jgi:hypothetical protein